MADITTTSSKMELKAKQMTITPERQTPQMPKSGEAHLLKKLANNLSESYQIVKQRQQHYNELSEIGSKRQKHRNLTKNKKEQDSYVQSSVEEDDDGEGAWQEVINKLKRKKKLSASLTSVSDLVNQEKRTKIEGMQLNYRGKLQLNESMLTTKALKLHTRANTISQQQQEQQRVIVNSNTVPIVVASPPPTTGAATPPPRLKRKLQENVVTIQKLNALSEQLRMEINELKANLTTERSAVRVLRAQNEAETRKYKSEVKRLQNIVELMKKNSSQAANTNAKKNAELQTDANGATSLTNYEIQRLTNELQTLKEAYKALEEKKVINIDADRRKTADIREMKDAYEIRLTQLSKSAKIEISRLLEELKSKERNIGQLKKELQVLQTRSQKSQNEQNNKNSRNATTSPMAMKQTTTTNKPKRNLNKKSTNEQNSKKIHLNDDLRNSTKIDEKNNENDENKDTTSIVQDTNEMKTLNDLELFNNTKNLQNTVTINLVKPTVKVNSNNSRIQSSKLKSLVNIFENETQKLQNSTRNENLKRSSNTTTPINCTENEQQMEEKEFHSLPQVLTERLIDTKPLEITTTTETTVTRETMENEATVNKHNEEQQHSIHEYRTKDNNSDSDSALSSAPPSISPQPPPSDLQTNDIWQTIRSYTSDIDKLQKDVDTLQKENESLHLELEVAKEQILENEKTAMEANTNNTKLKSLMDRIRCLEEQERELSSECNDLREQNELLEFRILELEDSSDKWSLPCQNATATTNNTQEATTKSQDLWNCIASNDNADPTALFESTNENISQRLTKMLEDLTLKEEHKKCLQQVLNLLEKQTERNLLMSQRSSSSNGSSGPNSFNTNSSSDEPSSLEMVKSRISDYSSASSSSSSTTSTCSNVPLVFDALNSSLKTLKPPAASSRIVATVPPYNSTQSLHIAPNNTPNDSPRKNRNCSSGTPTSTASWQSNSLSESGVFVESDFYSDNACTQTDFEEETEALHIGASELNKVEQKVPATAIPASALSQVLLAQHAAQQSDHKRLQYYQERLRLLENKLLIYESSGDLQAKHLADRLQREIQLEKELNELRERVELLETENATLEEEKCEFEEAENDTRLRLQRLEIELEILNQRNIELELSKEALSAKYKDCRSECLILRDDLAANETQLRNLEEDKRKAKEKLQFLHRLLPILILYNIAIGSSSYSKDKTKKLLSPVHTVSKEEVIMGNVEGCTSTMPAPSKMMASGVTSGCCYCKKMLEEVNCLQHQLKQLNDRYHEAMESADTHWLDLELEYKEREKVAKAKELCLKQKISQLEDILRADACAANEKIMQMEETEKELRCCLKRISKEHQLIMSEHQSITHDYECCREENQQLKNAMKPLNEALEEEKKRNKVLKSELCVLQKVQQDAEKRNCAELKTLRAENSALRNEFQNSEITNCELKEEVTTLEQQIQKLQCQCKCFEDKIRELNDEVRTKEEHCQRLEKHLERSEGYCLAQELDGSPSKRFKREDVTDLKSAAQGLCSALRNVKEECEANSQLNIVARDVKRLADCLLGEVTCDVEEVSKKSSIQCEEDKPQEQTQNEAQDNIVVDQAVEEVGSMPVPVQEEQVEELLTEVVLIEESAEFERNEGGHDLGNTRNVTVGMALMPQFKINRDDLPVYPSTSKDLKKKTICEVPSEMRKLDYCASCATRIFNNTKRRTATSETIIEEESIPEPKISTSSTAKKRTLKLRKPRRRFAYSLSWMAHIRRMVSQMNTRHLLNSMSNADEPDYSNSEIMQRKISYDSFHSLCEANEITDLHSDINFAETASIKTAVFKADIESKSSKSDKETETDLLDVLKVDSGVQVTNTDGDTEHLLRIIPSQTRSFINMLKASIEHTEAQADALNVKIAKRWETDGDFRNGLELLCRLTLNKSNNLTSFESYENFVAAMTGLKILTELLKPLQMPLLNQIETQLNDRLMTYHSKKKESEYYCNVYYPVKRPAAPIISLTDNRLK